MTGLTPHRTIHRLRALGRTFFALGASLLLVAALAPLATAAENAAPSDDRATFGSGNFGSNNPPNCATAFGGATQTQTNNRSITTSVTVKDVSTTNDSVAVTYEDTQAVNVTATGVTVVAVIIKGGNGYNAYGPGVTDMINPLNNSGKPAGLSHWTVCYEASEEPNETPTPSGTPTPSETPTPTETPTEEPTRPETPTEEPTQLETPTEEPTVQGVVIERPPAPAAPVDPPTGEAEPAPEVEVLGVTEELPRTGPEDLWLAGLALMLLGAGLLTVARGKAMDATGYATGTWWMSRRP